MVWSHLRQRIPQKPAGTRDTTKQATACSPVQAHNGGREQPHFSSTAGNRPILGRTVTNLASFHSQGNAIWGYLVNRVGPKSQGADTVWGGHKDRGRNQTSDERRSGLRGTIRFTAAGTQKQVDCVQIVVRFIQPEPGRISSRLHQLPEGGAVPRLVVRCHCFTSYTKCGSDEGESRWCLFPVSIQTAWVWNEIQYLGAAEYLGVVMVS